MFDDIMIQTLAREVAEYLNVAIDDTPKMYNLYGYKASLTREQVNAWTAYIIRNSLHKQLSLLEERIKAAIEHDKSTLDNLVIERSSLEIELFDIAKEWCEHL